MNSSFVGKEKSRNFQCFRAALLEQENVQLRLENVHLKQENIQLRSQINS
jgi:hypothetical protein